MRKGCIYLSYIKRRIGISNVWKIEQDVKDDQSTIIATKTKIKLYKAFVTRISVDENQFSVSLASIEI